MSDITIKVESTIERKDPTSFLPEEPMSYEIKKKKKKKKKTQEDPFKDIEEKVLKTEVVTALDPEVNIKAENIEVELDFNDFTDNSGFLVEGTAVDNEEPAIRIESQAHDALLLTFESVVSDNPVICKTEVTKQPAPCHICKVCHLLFKSQKTLQMHQKRKHKSFRKYFNHICKDCGMAYENKSSLAAHMKRKHGPNSMPDDKEERTCDICALVFKGMPRLRMHMRRKHNSFEDAFTHACKFCGLTYDRSTSLLTHIKRKHSGTKKEVTQWFNCPFCAKIFSRQESYARHVQRKHQVSEDSIKNASEDIGSSVNEQTGEVTCKECPLVFSSVNYLKLHMRRKHNALRENFRLKCRICNLSYDKIESLKRHVQRKHEEKYRCDVCNKQFLTREGYANHSHLKLVKECSVCGLIFASQGGLAKHLRLKHKVESPKVAFCNICEEGFGDKRQLKVHLMKVHWKVSYTCRYCQKVFKMKETHRRHILIKHPNGNQPINSTKQNCEQCSETFNDEFELCQHIYTVHGKETKPSLLKIKKEESDPQENFQCTKCSDSYPTFEQLKVHFDKSHSPDTQCQICGDMVSANELQKHIKTQHTNKDLQCKFCEFKTDVKLSLTQHILRHKNASTLHCDYAGCRYKTYFDLAMQKHKRRHLDLGVKLQCAHCPFQSMNKYILKYHEEAHETGKKRYTCDQCDYATILPANLVQHKYKHSAEKRFKCDVCDFATKYNTSLRFHVKKKHCDLPTFS